ncbi:MAG: hypothetical protein AMJ91_03710 [candidate division Zixibacteria bacterium SM23_73_3]|nr:MAG: hypothetical protein AMJ91_03710 [candidate division Zixibacteria bacterium SM23_73_3]
MKDLSKRQFFDQEARGWDDRYHQDDASQIRKLVDRFDLKPRDWVLDVGTGNGILLPHLFEKVEDEGKIVALDFSWRMVFEAAKVKKTADIYFINACCETLPIKDQTFDCIACLATFAHVNGKSKALNEMSRVLKKGGRLYIAHFLGKKELEQHHRLAGGAVEQDTLPPDSEMREMMEKTGLKDVRIVDQPGLYLASARKSLSC